MHEIFKNSFYANFMQVFCVQKLSTAVKPYSLTQKTQIQFRKIKLFAMYNFKNRTAQTLFVDTNLTKWLYAVPNGGELGQQVQKFNLINQFESR